MDVARNSFIVFLSKVLVGFLLFLSQILLARKLGPEGFGVYNLFLAIIGTAFLIGGLGLGAASIYLANRKKQRFSQLFLNSMIFGLGWGILLVIIIYTLIIIFPPLVSGLSQKYVFLALIIIPLVILYNYCLSFLMAKFKIISWSLFSILYAFLILMGSITLVVIFNFSIGGAIYAVLISVLVVFVLAFFYTLKICGWEKRFNFTLLCSQLKFGAMVYLGDIFSTVSLKLNVFIVNLFLGITSVGYYAVSYNIAAALFFIPYSLQQILYPTWSTISKEEIDRKTPGVARQTFLVSVLAALLLFFIGREFIVIFYGRNFLPSIMPFFLILPGGVFVALASIFFNNFFAKGKPYITSFILISTLVLNILFNVLFIPILGIIGTALATSISYAFSAGAAVFFFWRMTKYPIKDILCIRISDITSLYKRFLRLFTSVGKIFNNLSSPDIKGLKEYYEKCAEQRNIINTTFESVHPYKRLLYAMRVDKIMKLLDVHFGEKALEIGCAEGYYTKKISEITSNLTATDISKKFLEKAKNYNPHKTCQYMCCPVERLPFSDNSFDKVLMSEVIEHLFDWRHGIEEVYRVLKPGGIVVISTPNKLSYFNILCHTKILLRNQPFEGDHIKEFSRKELVRLLSEYFIIEEFDYANYFPIILPPFLVRPIGFKKMKRIVQFIEKICTRIIFIREAGLIIFIRARKKS